MRKRTTPSHLAGTRRISRPAPAWSCHALADMSGAQLWMGSVPKELDADAISTAFVTLGARADRPPWRSGAARTG